MDADRTHLDRFVGAVHRRMTCLRVAERVGIGLLAGLGMSLALMAVLMRRGAESGGPVLIVIAGGALAGLAWGLSGRPSRVAAAMAADRQLKCADLLTTAWAFRNDPGQGDFALTVLALADARCRAASPDGVVTHRLGPRSWGGIGVVAALVAGVYLLGPETKGASAAAGPASPRGWQETEAERERERGNDSRDAAAPDLRRPNVPGGGDDEADPLKSAVPNEPANKNDATASNPPPADPTDSAGADSVGGGSAQSGTKPAATAQPDPASGGAAKAGGTGSAAAGGGAAQGGTGADASAQAGMSAGAGAAKDRSKAPVWRGDHWPADQDAARAAIRGGKIPDAYRDLVRDYFERE